MQPFGADAFNVVHGDLSVFAGGIGVKQLGAGKPEHQPFTAHRACVKRQLLKVSGGRYKLFVRFILYGGGCKG